MDTAGILLIVWAGIIPAIIVTTALVAGLIAQHHKHKGARIEAVTLR